MAQPSKSSPQPTQDSSGRSAPPISPTGKSDSPQSESPQDLVGRETPQDKRNTYSGGRTGNS